MSHDETSLAKAAPAHAATHRIRGFLLAGLAVALLLAGVVSFYASREPDGLEKVSADHGLDANATDSHTAGSPLAGYEVRGVADGRLSVGAAGAVGVGATFVLAGGLFLLVRRGAGARTDSAATDQTSA